MRIEYDIQEQELYPSTNMFKVTGKTVSNFSDKLQISSMGKEFSIAKQALALTPDIREDLVSSIKERIKNGTYEVSGEAFADKLFRKYFKTYA